MSDGPALRPAKIRLDSLDSLRGISALMVIFYHMDFNPILYAPLLIRHSYLFVDFFFVLSGFIMFYNYDRIAGAAGLARFIALRFFRLYPLHIAMLFAFIVWNGLYAAVRQYSGAPPAPATSPDSDGIVDLILNVTLLNGMGFRFPGFNTPSWSISVEFWTYLVFGAALVAATRLGRAAKAAMFAALSICGLLIVLKWVVPLHFGRMDAYAYPRCIHGFFLGAALCAVLDPAARAIKRGGRASSFAGGAVQFVVLATAMAVLTLLGYGSFDVLMPALFAAVIASFVLWPSTWLTGLAATRPLLWLGKHSYSIYMVHWLILVAIGTVLRVVLHVPTTGKVFDTSLAAGIGLTILTLALVMFAASFTYRYIEEPGRLLGRRLLSKPKPAPGDAVRAG